MELVNMMVGGVVCGEFNDRSIRLRTPLMLFSKDDKAKLKSTGHAGSGVRRIKKERKESQIPL